MPNGFCVSKETPRAPFTFCPIGDQRGVFLGPKGPNTQIRAIELDEPARVPRVQRAPFDWFVFKDKSGTRLSALLCFFLEGFSRSAFLT